MALPISLLTVTTLALGPVGLVNGWGEIGGPDRPVEGRSVEGRSVEGRSAESRSVPSLESRVAAPLVHLRWTAAGREGSDPVALEGAGPVGSDVVWGLFDDPALRALWSGGPAGAMDGAGARDGAGTAESNGGSARTGSRRLLDQLGALSTGELEFAVVALLPRPGAADLPLMVGRIELSEKGRELLEGTLDTGPFSRGRTTADVPVYRFEQVDRGGEAGRGSDRVGPGELFELALVGRHLLVANHGATLDELLRDSLDRTASAHPESLDADPVHRAMRERLLAPRADAPRADAPRADAPRADAPRADAPRADGGSTTDTAAPRKDASGTVDAVLSLDWPRLAPRLSALRQAAAGDAATGPLGSWMFDAVGLGQAERVVVGFEVVDGARNGSGSRPHARGEAPAGGAAAPNGRRATRSGQEQPFSLRTQPFSLRTTVLVDRQRDGDGLWSAAESRSVRDLVEELPVPAVASMTVAMDADQLFPDSRDSGSRDSGSRDSGSRDSGSRDSGSRDSVVPSGLDWFGLRLAGTCRAIGLDFADHVRPRLGDSIACQAVLVSDVDTAAVVSVAAVLSVATRSSRDAEQLFDSLCRGLGLERRDDGASRPGRESGEWAELPLPGGLGESGARRWTVGVSGSALVFGPGDDVMPRLRERERGVSRSERARQRREVRELAEQLVEQLEARTGGPEDSRPVGVLQVDGSTFAAADRAAVRHVGLLFVDDEHVRLEVWSTDLE